MLCVLGLRAAGEGDPSSPLCPRREIRVLFAGAFVSLVAHELCGLFERGRRVLLCAWSITPHLVPATPPTRPQTRLHAPQNPLTKCMLLFAFARRLILIATHSQTCRNRKQNPKKGSGRGERRVRRPAPHRRSRPAAQLRLPQQAGDDVRVLAAADVHADAVRLPDPRGDLAAPPRRVDRPGR